MKREHSVFKIICFILGYCFVIGIPALSGLGVSEGTSLWREVGQCTAVEMAGLILVLLFYVFVFRKVFTAAGEYKLYLPDRNIVCGIFLIMPLLVFLETAIIYFDTEHLFFLDQDGTWQDIVEGLVYIPVGAFLGPVFEELCCRVLCISSFSTRGGRVAAFILTSVLFALCHGSNWLYVLPTSIWYGAVLLLSKNVVVPMLLHVAWNTATYLVPEVSMLYILLNPHAVYGVMGVPLPVLFLIAAGFAAGVSVFLKEWNRKRFRNGD